MADRIPPADWEHFLNAAQLGTPLEASYEMHQTIQAIADELNAARDRIQVLEKALQHIRLSTALTVQFIDKALAEADVPAKSSSTGKATR